MEQKTENLPEETHAEASQLNAPAGNEAESVATDSFSLEDLNKITGRTYKDKETALNSIREWQSQAGKVADLEGKLKTAKADPDTPNSEVAELKAQLDALNEKLTISERESFFNSNEEYTANRTLIEKLAKADGITPAEVVASEDYQKLVAQPAKRTVAMPNNVQPATQKEFNPADHAGDADALAKHVAENFILKK